ncbi:MAG: Rieske (2Fe-2S) protein [Gammaproteobacteria bacterium]
MNKSHTETLLCRIEELDSSYAIAREIAVGTRRLSCIVYARDGQVRVFLNSCPHTGIRLEWRENDFMDASGAYLMCSMHGALFRPNDGGCLEGPCVGESLIMLENVVRDGNIYVLNAENTPKSARSL